MGEEFIKRTTEAYNKARYKFGPCDHEAEIEMLSLSLLKSSKEEVEELEVAAVEKILEDQLPLPASIKEIIALKNEGEAVYDTLVREHGKHVEDKAYAKQKTIEHHILMHMYTWAESHRTEHSGKAEYKALIKELDKVVIGFYARPGAEGILDAGRDLYGGLLCGRVGKLSSDEGYALAEAFKN